MTWLMTQIIVHCRTFSRCLITQWRYITKDDLYIERMLKINNYTMYMSCSSEFTYPIKAHHQSKCRPYGQSIHSLYVDWNNTPGTMWPFTPEWPLDNNGHPMSLKNRKETWVEHCALKAMSLWSCQPDPQHLNALILLTSMYIRSSFIISLPFSFSLLPFTLHIFPFHTPSDVWLLYHAYSQGWLML